MAKEDEKPVASSSEEEEEDEASDEESSEDESSESTESAGEIAPDSIPVPDVEKPQPSLLPPSLSKTQSPAPPPQEESDGKDGQNVTVQLTKSKTGDTNLKRKFPEANESGADTAEASQYSKKLFTKIFTDHEEIILLQGMLQVDNLPALYENMKNKIAHFEKSYKQFTEKVRRLKEKYMKNQKKGGPNLGDLHEIELYKLSNAIWGNLMKQPVVGNGSNVVRKDGINNRSASVELQCNQFEVEPVPSCFLGLTIEEQTKLLKKGAELFESGNPIEGADEWKNLELEEMEFFRQKLDLVDACNELLRKRVNLIVDGIRSRRINKGAV